VDTNQKNVLLFDLDGTLVDSAPDLALAINKMLSDVGRTNFSEDEIHGWVGNGARVLTERALSGSINIDKTLSANEVDDALVLFLAHYKANVCVNSVLYKGVKEGLLALKEAGCRLAVVTNKPGQFVEPILSGLGIYSLFETCIGGDALSEKKPHPAQLFLAAERLNVGIDHCVMIGDSKNDIQAAKAANMFCAGLTYGYNYGEPISNYNPDICCDSFGELVAQLLRE